MTTSLSHSSSKTGDITGEQVSNVSFWCNYCKKDFDLRGRKTAWVWDGGLEWYWQAICPTCGRKLVRYSEEMAKLDPYYKLSRKVRLQAHEGRKDVLQPGQSGFSTYYPEAQRKLDESKEKAEIAKEKKKKVNKAKYDKISKRLDFKNDKLAKKVKELYLGE